jgi:hypothetical protein
MHSDGHGCPAGEGAVAMLKMSANAYSGATLSALTPRGEDNRSSAPPRRPAG